MIKASKVLPGAKTWSLRSSITVKSWELAEQDRTETAPDRLIKSGKRVQEMVQW